MELKAYFVTSSHCHHCDIALDALRDAHGDKWEPLMEQIKTNHPIAQANKVKSTPTLLVVDESDNNKLVAQAAGSNNLNEEFWSQFFTSVK